MKLATGALPTKSAQSISETVKLLPKERGRDTDAMDLYDDMLERLTEFQQMSFVCEFEAACIAYHGIELDEDQLVALDLIYKTTQPWLLGHVIGELLTLLSSDSFNSKEAVAAAQLILGNLIEDGIVDKDNAARLVVNLYGQQNKEEVDASQPPIVETKQAV